MPRKKNNKPDGPRDPPEPLFVVEVRVGNAVIRVTPAGIQALPEECRTPAVLKLTASMRKMIRVLRKVGHKMDRVTLASEADCTPGKSSSATITAMKKLDLVSQDSDNMIELTEKGRTIPL